MFALCNLNITGLLQGQRPEIFARIGVGCWKKWLTSYKTLKRGKIGPRLLLRSNMKSYTRFRLVPKSMTLDDLDGSLCILFQNMCVFQSSLWMKIDLYCQRQRCSPMTLVSANIRFVPIFEGVHWREGVKRQWGNRKHGFSRLLTLRLQHVKKWDERYYICLSTDFCFSTLILLVGSFDL